MPTAGRETGLAFREGTSVFPCTQFRKEVLHGLSFLVGWMGGWMKKLEQLPPLPLPLS